jgi:hypothetical protein
MSKEEDEAFTALLEERTRMGAWRASCAQEEGGQENGGQEDEEGSVPAITPGLPQRVFSVQRFRVQGRRGDWARLLGRSPLCWVGAEDLATQPRSPFRGSEFRREEGIRRGSWGAVRSAALAPRISRCSPARRSGVRSSGGKRGLGEALGAQSALPRWRRGFRDAAPLAP